MQQYLEAGRVVTTHGVRGEVKMELWCDGVDFLRPAPRLYLSPKGGRSLEVESIRPQGRMALVKFAGVDRQLFALKIRIVRLLADSGSDDKFGGAAGLHGEGPAADFRLEDVVVGKLFVGDHCLSPFVMEHAEDLALETNAAPV